MLSVRVSRHFKCQIDHNLQIDCDMMPENVTVFQTAEKIDLTEHLIIRNRDRSIHWQTLKYENFMLEPETWTVRVMEFLEANTGDKALVNKCLQSTKEDSQAKSVLSKNKMKETKKVTAGRLPQNFQEIADETFTKFGLPTTTQFDKLFM